MKLWSAAVAVTVVGLGGALVPGTAVAAEPLHCGDVITANATLTHDLTCSGDGLTIAAPGVVLDLDHHTITGSGVGVGVFVANSFDVGVDLTGIVVTNGTIRGFDSNISVGVASSASASKMRLSGRVYADDAASLAVSGSRLEGVSLTSAGSNSFLGVDSSVATHGLFMQGAVAGGGSSLRDSTVSGGFTMSCSQGGMDIERNVVTGGLRLQSFECGSMIADNRFDGAGKAGIEVDFQAPGDIVRIMGNRFRNFTSVVTVTGPRGVADIENNLFERNGDGVDICHGSSGGDCGDVPAEVTLVGNTFKNNSGSGVYAEGGYVTVTNNVAVNNGGWGMFFAVPPTEVIDGGGNRASHNGAGQCAGVTCS